MRLVKIRKSWLNDASLLLKKVGALQGNQAFPSDVYISEEDYKTLEYATTQFGKKMGFRGDRLKSAVGFELLNLGPNTLLAKALKPGYVLVDDDAIRQSTEAKS
jgi:hypothetical protein